MKHTGFTMRGAKLMIGLSLLCSTAAEADLIQQSTSYTRTVLMTQASDHVTGATGLTLTVTESRAGGAFVPTTALVTEIGNGWYKIALTATDTSLLGPLNLHIVAVGADPTDTGDQVVAFNPNDPLLLGLTGIATLTNQTTLLNGQAGIATKTNLIGTNGGDSPNTVATQSNVTTIQTRIGSPVAATLSADIANAYARLGAPAGASLSADIASVGAGIAGLPSAAVNASAVWGANSRTLTALPASAPAWYTPPYTDYARNSVVPVWYVAPYTDYAKSNTAPAWWVTPPTDYQQRNLPVMLPASVVPANDVNSIVNGLLGATVDSGGGTTISVRQSLFLAFVSSVGKFGTAVRSTASPWTITVPFLRLDGTTTGWTYVTTYTDNTFSKAVSRTFTTGILP